jgi:hypothetical protein
MVLFACSLGGQELVLLPLMVHALLDTTLVSTPSKTVSTLVELTTLSMRLKATIVSLSGGPELAHMLTTAPA